jgi:hypothetical protein
MMNKTGALKLGGNTNAHAARQLEVRGGLRIMPDSLASGSTRLGGYNAAGDVTGITPGAGLTLANDTLTAYAPRYITMWDTDYSYSVLETEKKLLLAGGSLEGGGTFTKTDSTITLPPGRWKISYDANVILIPDSGNDISISILLKAGASSIPRATSIVTRNSGTANSVFSPSATTVIDLSASTDISLSALSTPVVGTALFYAINLTIEKL